MSGLFLVYEPEAACRQRLLSAGFEAERALEVSSYLAQSTDLAHEFDAIANACAARGLTFNATALDDFPSLAHSIDPDTDLVWTLTDGIAYFRGSAAMTLARLGGLQTFGSDDSLFALCQDKFRSGAVLRALDLPSPHCGLARNGDWIVQPPASSATWFVKPNRLGAKIGIWADSRCHDLDHALTLSRRVFDAYRDDVVVQPYVAGRNARASFLAVEPNAGAEALGVVFVDSGGDFQTMADSLALYGETGDVAKSAGAYAEPQLVAVGAVQPEADRAVRALAVRLMQGFGLRDVYSIDLRIEPDDTIHLIEFEVCPGLPCFDFRDYCRRQWGLSLAESMAAAAASRLVST